MNLNLCSGVQVYKSTWGPCPRNVFGSGHTTTQRRQPSGETSGKSSINLSIFLSIYLSIYLSIHLSIFTFICLHFSFIFHRYYHIISYLFIYLSHYLFLSRLFDLMHNPVILPVVGSLRLIWLDASTYITICTRLLGTSKDYFVIPSARFNLTNAYLSSKHLFGCDASLWPISSPLCLLTSLISSPRSPQYCPHLQVDLSIRLL